MKNLTNFGFVVLLLVVLGCNCQKIKDLANKNENPVPSPVSSSSPAKGPNSASSPSASSSSDSSPAGINQANYDKVKNGMSRKEVEAILGGAGERVSSSEIGKTKIESYKWAGKDYAFIFVNFTNDKVTFKSEANLK